LGSGRYHFARRFRQSTGTTPHEFVLQQRVERAKALLDRTNTVLQIRVVIPADLTAQALCATTADLATCCRASHRRPPPGSALS